MKPVSPPEPIWSITLAKNGDRLELYLKQDPRYNRVAYVVRNPTKASVLCRIQRPDRLWKENVFSNLPGIPWFFRRSPFEEKRKMCLTSRTEAISCRPFLASLSIWGFSRPDAKCQTPPLRSSGPHSADEPSRIPAQLLYDWLEQLAVPPIAVTELRRALPLSAISAATPHDDQEATFKTATTTDAASEGSVAVRAARLVVV